MAKSRVVSHLLGFLGAVIGGALGYSIFAWLVNHRFYGLMIPGALLGLGCSLLARHPSAIRGAVCAVGGLGLGLYSEWKFFPFRADGGFGYFLRHVADLSSVTQLMLVLGAGFAYWLGKDSRPGFLPMRAGSASTHVTNAEASGPE